MIIINDNYRLAPWYTYNVSKRHKMKISVIAPLKVLLIQKLQIKLGHIKAESL